MLIKYVSLSDKVLFSRCYTIPVEPLAMKRMLNTTINCTTTHRLGATGILPVASSFAYNDRSEVLSAAIGTNLFTHAYDDIGNHLLFGDNATTNTFTHNALNQMVGRAAPSAPPTSFTYTPDGGLSSDGIWFYAYDAEDQLISVTSSSLTNGATRVLNSYDYRRRRISKTVQRLNSTIPPPPAPPTGMQEWETIETRTFIYDDWNLIHETIYTIDGGATNTTEVQYFWGLDLSGTLQGAGGVGGLLAVSRNGQLYFPTFDNNGNVTKYIDESGNVAAAYEYDDFGRTISQSGPLADFFLHRFSTKYYDPETGLYYYGYRFYFPDWRIWLNRDPMGEDGGVNLQAFCRNNALLRTDPLGLESYCDCFDYTISVMRRNNWTWPRFWEADYDHDDRWGNGASLMWSTASYGGFLHVNYITQVTVAVVPRRINSKHCGCGTGRPDNLPYRPYVIIDGPLSRRINGQIMGEYAWSIIFNIAGQAGFDYWISQNVLRYQPGTRTRYKVTVTDGFDNVCGTKEFSIQY